MTAPQQPNGFTARDAITAAVIVIILAFSAWLKVAVDITGTVVSGEVVEKRIAVAGDARCDEADQNDPPGGHALAGPLNVPADEN